uniref:helicase associated domain-containing protein n=1 Tax=Streptomyces sp. NBC_01592 TaxID=2975889 RepID=UPI002F9150AB
MVQGANFGRWVSAQRFGWGQLLPVQRWLLENTLKVTPGGEEERPVKQTQDGKWAVNLAAARAFFVREGHLRVPRKHVEELDAARSRQVVRTVLTGPWWSSSACGSTTSANAPGSSPSSVVRISIGSGCAGRRPERRTPERPGSDGDPGLWSYAIDQLARK